jgi:SAM-dependent MidA family methyltransferase
MKLSEIIIQKIGKDGPMSFYDFMEMCLYYPGMGYYTSLQDKIGKKGDFYTSSNISSVFGAMIGKQLEQMWDITGKKKFTIVEYGAGTGMLSHDILEYLKNNPAFYEQLNYCIIEKSPVMREKEKALLTGKVNWYDTIRDIPVITGCILSNELVDNFSVHQVVMQDELMEVFVDYKNGFVETLKPAGNALTNYLAELNVVLPKGFRTEINLEATEWIKEIAACLQKGFVLTIDYGYLSEELYKDRRSRGTLLCYHKHTINDQPYSNIGEQDITTHINFSALSHWGLKYGLDTCGFTNQAGFLLGLGCEEHLTKTLLQKQDNYLHLQQYSFLKYTLLVDMGHKFNILIQRKGVPDKMLLGLR